MAKENENLNSQIEEIGVTFDENDDAAALKEKLETINAAIKERNSKITEVNESNRQLFARAKKAEGFELKDDKWVKVEKPEKKPEAKEPKQLDEFDDAQFTYLALKGIESDEDVEWVKGELKEHGGNLRTLFGNKYFQSSLKERKDAAAALNASPGSKRSAGAPNDSIEYHLTKYLATGELPSDPEMAEKVIEARVGKEVDVSPFDNTRQAGVPPGM